MPRELIPNPTYHCDYCGHYNLMDFQMRNRNMCNACFVKANSKPKAHNHFKR